MKSNSQHCLWLPVKINPVSLNGRRYHHAVFLSLTGARLGQHFCFIRNIQYSMKLMLRACRVTPRERFRAMYLSRSAMIRVTRSLVEIPLVRSVALNFPRRLGTSYASFVPAVTYGYSSCATKSILLSIKNSKFTSSNTFIEDPRGALINLVDPFARSYKLYALSFRVNARS